jgi:hypothetical protein
MAYCSGAVGRFLAPNHEAARLLPIIAPAAMLSVFSSLAHPAMAGP